MMAVNVADDPGSAIINIILAVYFLIVGLCFGSFSSAIIYREGERRSWFDLKGENKRSICPNCHHKLSARDLIPVWSWLSLHGKCRYCGTGVSPSYPILELICAGLAILIFSWDASLFQRIALLLGMPFFVSFTWLIAFKRRIALRPLFLFVFFASIAFLTAYFNDLFVILS